MANRVEVVAIDGLLEIVPGDDLPSLIADALAAATDDLPLHDEDVLVVTQKIVSKAEGAVVDLTTIEPRPEVVEYARQFDRDPRQVELVLREAKRVVRMENGLVITETHHGFVCANGGIDASNVGPRSGDVVTLLPRDPDASADRIRAADPRPSGPRPASHRVGQLRAAMAVRHRRRRDRRFRALPLDDLRGTPDADGRVMKSTVRAVADEIASAAELVLGKTARRPLALVRGATFRRGDGRIKDLIMPAEMDLFR